MRSSFGIFVLALTLFTPSVPIASAASAPYCRPGETPGFHFGFAALRAQLGTGMGEPEQCEHGDGFGGTTQFTTTGIASYTPSTNLVLFNVMWGPHLYKWALAPDGLLFWEGEVFIPPDNAPVVSDSICAATLSAPATMSVAAACAALSTTELGPAGAASLDSGHSPPAVVRPAQVTPLGGVIDTYIDGDFNGWDGETVFRLQNGQIWQQASYAYTYSYAYSPRVLIYPSNGGWHMQVDGMTESIPVQRLR